jgi:uncharacterized protein YbaA (DUF1428 family)
MSYIDGFVIPVDAANQVGFLSHANAVDAFFLKHGAIRVVETWADDVPDGKVTDFKRSVRAAKGETVAFAWIEWPDKATRDTGLAAMTDNAEINAIPVPFDGKRMIFGGFESLVDAVTSGQTGYVDGFVVPVTPANKAAYLDMAQKSAAAFLKHGALRSSENWGEDVPDGKVTDFKRSVLAEGDENVVFSWLEWPDKTTRDAGWAKVMSDPDMQPPAEMPFDGKRMFWGGFKPVVDLK